MHVCILSLFSHVRLFATSWTVAHQVPLSMGFSMQEHWSGLPCPSPGDPPNLGIKPASLFFFFFKPVSLKSPALVGGLFTTNSTWEAPNVCVCVCVYVHI